MLTVLLVAIVFAILIGWLLFRVWDLERKLRGLSLKMER